MKSLRMLLWLTLVTGVAYPLLVWVIAQATMKEQAEGSIIANVGSKLIAQKFENERYFWPRPSANDYNGLSSGGSNLGPINPALKKAVDDRKAALGGGTVPSELLYASGSGLDPHISPATAHFQIERVAKARKVNAEQVKALVDAHVEHSFFGPPCVNVLQLNLALDQVK